MTNNIASEKNKLFWGYFICCFCALFNCFRHTMGPGFWYLEFVPVYIGLYLVFTVKAENKKMRIADLLILAAAFADAAAVIALLARIRVAEPLELLCLLGQLAAFVKVLFCVREICIMSGMTAILFRVEISLIVLVILWSLFYAYYSYVNGISIDSAETLDRLLFLKNVFQHTRLSICLVSIPFLLNDLLS